MADMEEVQEKLHSQDSPPKPIIKEEIVVSEDAEPAKASAATDNIPKETVPKASDTKGLQGPSPPSSLEEPGKKSSLVGLGIVTSGKDIDAAPATAGASDSAVDSLFGGTDGDADGKFDGMDFFQDITSSNEVEDPTQPKFDLSTFGNDAADFDMAGLNVSPAAEGNSNNNNNNTTETTTNNKHQDDLFNMGSGVGSTGAADMMDLDLGMADADGNAFNELFFGGDDDVGHGGNAGEMEHGEFDDAFFGLK